ncbi:MAG: hypothetical protein JEZ08_22430 [Clostridiales bacterium]|nr:hypothetical protein [Clostridiales bacterium]
MKKLICIVLVLLVLMVPMSVFAHEGESVVECVETNEFGDTDGTIGTRSVGACPASGTHYGNYRGAAEVHGIGPIWHYTTPDFSDEEQHCVCKVYIASVYQCIYCFEFLYVARDGSGYVYSAPWMQQEFGQPKNIVVPGESVTTFDGNYGSIGWDVH